MDCCCRIWHRVTGTDVLSSKVWLHARQRISSIDAFFVIKTHEKLQFLFLCFFLKLRAVAHLSGCVMLSQDLTLIMSLCFWFPL